MQDLKSKLQEASQIVSLAYIAQHYFGRSRAWLHQRINGNIVNGKPAQFNEEELKTLNFALQDIAKKSQR